MPESSPAAILAALIAIDSQVTKSNVAIIEYLKSLFAGFPYEVYPCTKGDLELHNLVVRIPGRTPGPALIFAGHTDTVPATPSWRYDPFTPRIENGHLHGLGAADMKAGLAAAIAAVQRLEQPPLHDVYLFFTADEEDTALGVKKLASVPAVRDIMRGASIVVGESNNGQIGLGCRGFLGLRITCRGEAFHSAITNYTMNMQKNANYIAYQVLQELLAYERTLQPTTGDLALQSSQNIGMIYGGTAQNTIADRCVIEVSRRLPAGEHAENVYRTMVERILRVQARIDVEATAMDESYAVDPDLPFIRNVAGLCHEELQRVEYYHGTGWNEGAIYSRFGSTVVLGPGTSGTAHQPDEWTELALLEQVTAIYRRLAEDAAWEG